jgi:hypothetical protein
MLEHGSDVHQGGDGPLMRAGVTKYDVPGMLPLLRGRLDLLAKQIDADPPLVNRRFPELDCGMSGGRSLTLQGATLLHVAAEFGHPEAAALLLDRGADVNARATVDESGVGGQTALFHAVTQYDAALWRREPQTNRGTAARARGRRVAREAAAATEALRKARLWKWLIWSGKCASQGGLDT